MAARPAPIGRHSPQVLEVSVTEQTGPLRGEQVVRWLAGTTGTERAAAEELRGGGRQLDCGALQQLVGALTVEGAFPRLLRLDLSNSLLTDEGCMQVAGGLLALQQRPIGGLRCLLASGNQIGHAGAEVLATSFFCGGASSSTSRGGAGGELTLSLSENPLGDQGVAAVAAAVRSQECRAALQLCETSCGSEGCTALAQSLHRIAALDLSYNTVPTGALNMLVGALGPPLRQLGLCRVAPGGSGGLFRGSTVQALAASLAGDSPPPLVTLTLAGNDLQDAGMRTLAATLSGASVEELDLASNRLQDGNLLAKVLARGSLLSLSLDRGVLSA
ncbi:unnamed protein product [Prorocentrum cordatum]|uniref:Uncharacterized protein n=1 Tax=Prorocentrum cordatum TaxID=2364126 RepID=A0ABN9R5Z5_9DINO|nr:unnamed protein product [Polarella glacialis]